MALKDPGSFEWKILFGISGAIDIAQWFIDLIPAYGEAANEIIDPIVGVCLASYFQLRGVSMAKKPGRIVSLIISYLLEAFLFSVPPAWFFDVLYTHATVKQEWAAEQAFLAENEDQENQPLNRVVNGQAIRRPQNIQKPLNVGGKRLPNGGI